MTENESPARRVERFMSLIEAGLEAHLPVAAETPGRLHEAMRYAVFGGGKRIRPMLCLAACAACGGEPEAAVPAAVALEMVHTYSLVHDDLPAMDDDDLRRGRPSCHRAFDEATAILVGDGLLTEAFAALAAAPGLSAGQRVELVALLASAAGSRGMVGGQQLDLDATGADPTAADALTRLERLHGWKTGALLAGAARAGGIVAGADAAARAALERYGRAIGLAFQIVDDILDATAGSAELGKTAGKDAEAGKLTYVAVLGVGAARGRAEELLSEALDALTALPGETQGLRDLARKIVSRRS